MTRQFDVFHRQDDKPMKVGTVTAESLTHANKKATLLFGRGVWAKEKHYA